MRFLEFCSEHLRVSCANGFFDNEYRGERVCCRMTSYYMTDILQELTLEKRIDHYIPTFVF